MPSTPHQDSLYDEIDLRELLQTLWRARLLILAIVLATTALAIIYSLWATPAYKTEVVASAPTLNDLGNYHLIHKVLESSQTTNDFAFGTRVNTPEPPSLVTPRDAYTIFVNALYYMRQAFFEQVYLPAHPNAKTQTSKDELRATLAKRLSIKMSGPESLGPVTITLEGEDPRKITNWLNQYIDIVRTEAQKKVALGLATVIKKRIQEIDDDIDGLRAIAAKERQNRISNLEDALKLAEVAQIVKPETHGIAATRSDDTTFLLGSDVLSAEIELLKRRTDDDPYIQQLPKLLYAKHLLRTMDISHEPLSVATIVQAATSPGLPTRPRKNIIIVIGVLLGVMIGVLATLTRRRSGRSKF